MVDRKRKNVIYVTKNGQIPEDMAPDSKNGVQKLLFTRRPTDWCDLDRKGNYFNVNRKCDPDGLPHEQTSCSNLCCGYGHIKRTRLVESKCHCKFTWSKTDELVCETCTEKTEEYVCRSPNDTRL